MIHSRIKWVVLSLCVLSFSNLAHAKVGASFAFGDGTKKVQAYRVGVQREWATDRFTNLNRTLRGYWELAFTRINNTQQFTCQFNDHAQAVSLAAVLRIPIQLWARWYIDLGIGGAQFSAQEVATRELGSKLLFEDRAGIGILLGSRQQIEIGYRFLHFSNAYLADKNQSINLHLLTLGFWFS